MKLQALQQIQQLQFTAVTSADTHSSEDEAAIPVLFAGIKRYVVV